MLKFLLFINRHHPELKPHRETSENVLKSLITYLPALPTACLPVGRDYETIALLLALTLKACE